MHHVRAATPVKKEQPLLRVGAIQMSIMSAFVCHACTFRVSYLPCLQCIRQVKKTWLGARRKDDTDNNGFLAIRCASLVCMYLAQKRGISIVSFEIHERIWWLTSPKCSIAWNLPAQCERPSCTLEKLIDTACWAEALHVCRPDE